jgi:KUP system potassium uptake protein
VYVPAVNLGLLVTVVAIVVGFGSSAALASAYGVAVTGTFILNTILFLAVARLLWHKPKRLIALGTVVFLSIEVTFFAANLTKVAHGGWLPLSVALLVFVALMTWRKGREIVTANRLRQEGRLRDFVEACRAPKVPIRRVPGTAVFLNPNPVTTPLALRANVEHNHVLHEHVIILSVKTERVPRISDADRVAVNPLGHRDDGITGLTARFGFQDEPDVPSALRLAAEQDLLEGVTDVDQATYFLTQITIVPTDNPGLSAWRRKLFLLMAHNASNPAVYFGLPDDRTVTMGERVDL